MQFLAARTIQCHWRSHLSRLRESRRWRAAITIQRWWRGFNTRRKLVYKLEDMLQQRLLDLYNKSATKIQALFRGWWTRRTVHDVYALHNMQACAASDLLSCVAYKLHHLLRTYSIPGIYSLRNSTYVSYHIYYLYSIYILYLPLQLLVACGEAAEQHELSLSQWSGHDGHDPTPVGRQAASTGFWQCQIYDTRALHWTGLQGLL